MKRGRPEPRQPRGRGAPRAGRGSGARVASPPPLEAGPQPPAMDGTDIDRRLRLAASARGLPLSEAAFGALAVYVRTLLLWRTRLPLVAQRDAAAIVDKHVDDSFAVVPCVEPGARVADLGSGAGFPGLVVAIACAEARVVLVESQRRKVSFLRAAIRALPVPNASALEARAEDLSAAHGLSGAFDVVVSRAAWPGADLFALARPLLRPDGVVIAMKTAVDAGAVLPPPYFEPLEPVCYRLSEGEERALLRGRLLPPRRRQG